MIRRPLGGSGIRVSVLSLGSWRTYQRIPREQALAVMNTAREAGIDFLDDARYGSGGDGHSEELFGELFRAAGWRRDAVVVANKLWWEFWPEQTAMQELDSSLERMRLDYLDLEYSAPPPPGLDVATIVRASAELITSGKLRAWGVLNWQPALIAEAARVADAEGLPAPCAAQLRYSLVERAAVDDPHMQGALANAGASVVASASLAFGALSGKYAREAPGGRIADELDDPKWAGALAAAEPLRTLAQRLGVAPAALAYAFALAGPSVASVVFGATRAEQVAENVSAVGLLERLDDEATTELRRIGRPPTGRAV
jgi:aryl-alcohol dehydrogenase-like predicted oxidoreductase